MKKLFCCFYRNHLKLIAIQGYNQTKKFLKRVPYNGQFCKNRNLKLDKTLRKC